MVFRLLEVSPALTCPSQREFSPAAFACVPLVAAVRVFCWPPDALPFFLHWCAPEEELVSSARVVEAWGVQPVLVPPFLLEQAFPREPAFPQRSVLAAPYELVRPDVPLAEDCRCALAGCSPADWFGRAAHWFWLAVPHSCAQPVD